MSSLDRLGPDRVTSEVDCHREEVLALDEAFRLDAGIGGGQRGGWTCTISLFILEDDFALGEEVEMEIAFASYNIGDDDVCELVDMEVASAFRGQGLAGRLVREVLADIRLKGGTRLYLFAYEPEEGSREDFFSRFGFSPLDALDEEWSATSLPHPMVLHVDEEPDD